MGTEEVKPKKIFISYGRKDAQELATRLETDLEEQGYDIWRDKSEMEAGKRWPLQIERAILECEVFIALLSPHAVRPDGVCRDEINMARFEKREIIPAMVLRCRPPLVIYSLDWIDFQNWKKQSQYEEAYQRLLMAISQRRCIEGVHGVHAPIFLELNPIDFGVEITRLTRDFTGREWLLEEINEWLQKETSRIFLITGDPGIGKSAIMAYLAQKHEQVVACHICRSEVKDTLNPNRFIKSITAQLATQLRNYRKALGEVDLELADTNDPGTLLRRLIIGPLKAEDPDKSLIILIDGLDEAFTYPSPNIVTVLHDQLEDLPTWVRLVLSSRKVPKILNYFSKFKTHEIKTFQEENIQDVRLYLEKRLKEKEIVEKLSKSGASTKTVADTIFEKGESNFLYVKEAIEGIKAGLIDPALPGSFPTGLIETYLKSFKRIFPEDQDYDEFRPILDVIIAAREPLTAKQISIFIERSEFNVRRDLQKVASFFPKRDGRYRSYHKALTDWLKGETEEQDLTYQVDLRGGNHLIAEKLLKAHRDGKEEDYMLDHLSHHLLFLEKWDELNGLLTDAKYLEKIDISQLNNYSEPLLTKYYGVKPEQTKILLDLKELTNKALPRIEKLDAFIPFGEDQKEYDTFGVKIEGNNIVGLALSYTDLTILPESIGNLTSLQELYLDHNKLTILPDSISKLTSLKKLDLISNKLTTLPESIGNLSLLKELNLVGNNLTSLPESIGNLSSLQELYLDHNKLTILPDSISKLTSLKKLDLISNKLTTLPESIGNLSLLKELNLKGNNLTSLPESIGNLSSLKEIHLRGNKLTSLPESIGNLKALEKLQLENHDLMTLPESIGNLSLLKELNLRGNNLTSLPESIGRLSSLQRLDLRLNQLTTLPESIGTLSSLKILILNSNQLETLPESIWNLSSLRSLHLDYNNLTTLSESIGKLTKLDQISLYGVKLTTIPESLGYLPLMKRYQFTDLMSSNKISRILRERGVKFKVKRSYYEDFGIIILIWGESGWGRD